ncbi:MAG TPA: phage tail tape measure protein, partial [Guyparkeria sp.]|nr:phage tail tape measure protein [Guyparkeria sp.]
MSKNTDVNLIIRAKDQAGKVLSRVAGTLGKVTAAGVAAGAAVATYFTTKMFAGGIKSAAGFEEQMAKIQAVTGASAEEMAALSKAAQDAGRTTTFTAKEAGEGLEILSRAGLSATDSIAALPEVLALAQGQSIGLAQAAGLVTDAVGIMGLSYAEAGRATDVLAKGSTLANTTVDDLGAALSYAGGSAKAAGLTIEETVGILDAMAESGLRGQRAGTALRNMLAQLEDPASKARKELAALGDESGDLGSALDTMAAAGDGASAAILAFGRESGPAVRALVSSGSEGIAHFTDQLNDAEGTARAAADVMTGPLNGAIKLLQSAWDSLTQYLTEPLLEPLTKEVKDLSEALSDAEQSGRLEKLRDAIVDTFKTGIKWVRDFASEIDISDLVDWLSSSVANIGKTFASVKDAGTTTANVMA